MRYTYKVRELGKDIVDEKTNEVGKDVGASEEMQAMSLKKLKAKLDHKKEYHIEYTNKKGNFISATIKGKERT
jgi:hypothetical protein